MNHYSDINYKALLEEFCRYKHYTEKQAAYLLRPEIYEKRLFELTPYHYAILVLQDMCGIGSRHGSKNPQYLKENITYISQFFDWCKEVKKIFPYNPFRDSQMLSYRYLLYQMIEELEIHVLYEDTLKSYVESMSCNQSTYAAILYLLFYGVSSLKELAGIRTGDIDFNTNTVLVNGRTIKYPQEVLDMIQVYRNEDTFYLERANSEKTERIEYLQYKDFLFKKPIRAEKHRKIEDDGEYISSMVIRLGRSLKNMGIDITDVTRSAFIDGMRKEFQQYSDQKFCDIFLSDRKINAGLAEKMKKVIKKYNFKSRTNEAMDACLPYIVKSRYYV